MLPKQKNIKAIYILIIALCLGSCQQNSSDNSQIPKNKNLYFPADVSTTGERNIVQITVA